MNRHPKPCARAFVRHLVLGTAVVTSFWSLFAQEASAQQVSLAQDAISKTASRATRESVPERAKFLQQKPSKEARVTADWVLDSGDNQGLPFLIVDKVHATVFAFDALGLMKGAAPALIGEGIGDDSVPGIGTRKLSSILPHERTTPAGRFVASLDKNIKGVGILWVDYDAAISLHRVVKGTPSERRAERLASPSAKDKRISFGCINVPVDFYETVVDPIFTGTDGIVYILPEKRSLNEVFGFYDAE